MATTYSWKVVELAYNYSHDSGNSNVVNAVTCWYYGISDAGTLGVSQVVFTLEDPPSEGFVAYENLTEEIILGWCTPTIDADVLSMHAAEVNRKIQEIEAPLEGHGLPWTYQPIEHTGEGEEF